MDELFDFEGRERIGIEGLAAYLEDRGDTAMVALMLKMFPGAPLSEVVDLSFGATQAAVYPAEERGLERADSRRRAKFAAGRAAARQALHRLGRAEPTIPSRTDRAPCWPAGMIGSIAHDHVFVVAAVARLGRFASIGVDIEPDEPLDPELIGTICSSAEQRRIAGPDAPRLARVIFSAEEAA